MRKTARSRTLNRLLWALQGIFGVCFVVVGLIHFIVPDGLPAQMSWMYELDNGVHYAAGTAEILGGLGLILPGLTRLVPRLTSLAATGLTFIMVGAILWHAGRGELIQIAGNAVLGTVMAFVAYGRWRLIPIRGRSRPSNQSDQTTQAVQLEVV